MLTHIHIKDFAIIENLELELQSGFTVVTGETGAGKSILMDAIELALGQRADNSIIRHGSERCDIALSFNIDALPEAKKWLIEQDFASDDECIVRRIISSDSRSRSTINGNNCPLQLLRELSNLLINIHGQHEHQALLKRDKQRQLLDNFASHPHLCQQVQHSHQEWRKLNHDMEKLQLANAHRDGKLELLRYQVQELEDLALAENEVETLEQEYKKLANAEQLIRHCNTALDVLDENEQVTALKQLHTAVHQLEPIKSLGPKINNAAELLNQAIIQTEEATHELRDYLHKLVINPERLEWLEQRLNRIYELARKHRVKTYALTPLTTTLKTELQQLEHADEYLQTLQQQITQLEQAYRLHAEQLGVSRKGAAKKLAAAVTAKIQTLGMANGKFDIQFEAVTEISAQGAERIEFMMTANTGQSLQPLHKVASGGELSRIGLAIQVITVQKENTATLIFDEVDTGISGGTAEIVGKLLRDLGNDAQVLCITHLPQVAAQGHQHFQVQKLATKNSTQTRIVPLAAPQRVEEVARMLGGVKITEQTLAHAREMLDLSVTVTE